MLSKCKFVFTLLLPQSSATSINQQESLTIQLTWETQSAGYQQEI